jgi:hypothetical protein
MDTEVKYINIKEFREKGFLQEVNRQFFHPLGLAIEVVIEKDGTEHLGGIWDYREHPEGIIFKEGVIDEQKIDYVLNLKDSKRKVRQDMFGSIIQPIQPTETETYLEEHEGISIPPDVNRGYVSVTICPKCNSVGPYKDQPISEPCKICGSTINNLGAAKFEDGKWYIRKKATHGQDTSREELHNVL